MKREAWYAMGERWTFVYHALGIVELFFCVETRMGICLV